MLAIHLFFLVVNYILTFCISAKVLFANLPSSLTFALIILDVISILMMILITKLTIDILKEKEE